MRESYKCKGQLNGCFSDKVPTSKEQRLSLFLENYLSDATERKSSANHNLKQREHEIEKYMDIYKYLTLLSTKKSDKQANSKEFANSHKKSLTLKTKPPIIPVHKRRDAVKSNSERLHVEALETFEIIEN